MKRSAWKGPYIEPSIFKLKKKRLKKTFSRKSVIPASLINKRVLVYTGRRFIPIKIDRKKIGYKFGQFSFTRKMFSKKRFSKNLKKNAKTKK